MDVRRWVEALAEKGLSEYAYNPLAGERQQCIVDAFVPAITKLVTELEDEARLLDSWIHQSITGGWSTHQVDPMRLRAGQIRAALADPEKP